MSIKVTKSKKYSNITKKSCLSPVKYSIDFLWSHSNAFDRNNKAKKFGFLNIEFAFINIGLYFSLL